MKMTKSWVKIFAGLITGLVNGMLGTGGGTIVVPYLEKSGVEPKKSHATAISVILPVTVVSAIFYCFSGNVKLMPTIILCLSGTVGGVVGAKLLNKIPKKYLCIIFGATMLYMAFRMIWGVFSK